MDDYEINDEELVTARDMLYATEGNDEIEHLELTVLKLQDALNHEEGALSKFRYEATLAVEKRYATAKLKGDEKTVTLLETPAMQKEAVFAILKDTEGYQELQEKIEDMKIALGLAQVKLAGVQRSFQINLPMLQELALNKLKAAIAAGELPSEGMVQIVAGSFDDIHEKLNKIKEKRNKSKQKGNGEDDSDASTVNSASQIQYT